MDISLSSALAPIAPYIPQVINTGGQDNSVTEPATDSAQNPQPFSGHSADTYEGAIHKLAQAYTSNFYPLGSTSFSIYKDQDGKLITRYVSELDGTITYVPEPSLVRHFPPASGNSALLSISA